MDITLTMKQQKRIEIIERALRNDLTVVEAAMVLGVSERQCYRIKARVRIRESKECSMATEAGPVNTSSRIKLSSGWWS
jgi:transposase-like protein